MIKTLMTAVFGTRFDRERKKIQPIVDQIHDHEERLKDLSEAELKAQTARFRERLAERTGALKARAGAGPGGQARLRRSGRAGRARGPLPRAGAAATRRSSAAVLDELLPEAFATVREACRRLLGTTVQVTGHELVWDMVPYDVQLIGGIVLHQGKIAEMATGEGKTLVATLPLYLNALAGRGAHLVTVNNYLARRDSQWMGHVFKYLGLTVALPGRHRAVLAGAPRGLPRRHHLRHQQRVRLRLPARQHGVLAGPAGAARARLRHHRRGRLDPHRRGADPADHLRAGGQRDRRQVRPVRPPGGRAGAEADGGGEHAAGRGREAAGGSQDPERRRPQALPGPARACRRTSGCSRC